MQILCNFKFVQLLCNLNFKINILLTQRYNKIIFFYKKIYFNKENRMSDNKHYSPIKKIIIANEKRILEQLGNGIPYKEIVKELGISVSSFTNFVFKNKEFKQKANEAREQFAVNHVSKRSCFYKKEQLIEELLDKNTPIIEIAKMFKTSKARIYFLIESLPKLKEKFDKYKNHTMGKNKGSLANKKNQISKLLDQKISLQKIADDLGVCYHAVYSCIKNDPELKNKFLSFKMKYEKKKIDVNNTLLLA